MSAAPHGVTLQGSCIGEVWRAWRRNWIPGSCDGGLGVAALDSGEPGKLEIGHACASAGAQRWPWALENFFPCTAQVQ